jgi:cytochrome b
MNTKILIWDRIVRAGHWLLACSFMTAYMSAESERWRVVHVVSGCLVFATVIMRVVWGFVGSYHARFINFVRHPKHAWTYLKSLILEKPEHHEGHNPAGGWAVLGLLGLSLLASVTGWMTYNNVGGAKLSEGHEFASNLAVLLVIVHVLAVIASSYLHRENLITSMFTGLRPGNLTARIRDTSTASICLYFLVLACIAYAAYRYT